MNKRRSTRWPLVAMMVCGLLLVAACSDDGGSSDDSSNGTQSGGVTTTALSGDALAAGAARLTIEDVGQTWTEEMGAPGSVQAYLDNTAGCEAMASLYHTTSGSRLNELRPRILTSPSGQIVSSGIWLYNDVEGATAFVDGLADPATDTASCMAAFLSAGGTTYQVTEQGPVNYGQQAYAVTLTPTDAAQSSGPSVQRFLWVRFGRVVASFTFTYDAASPLDEASYVATVQARLGDRFS